MTLLARLRAGVFDRHRLLQPLHRTHHLQRVPHLAFFRPLFRDLRGSTDPESLRDSFRSFLDSSRVNERTDDDKTLMLAMRQIVP